MFKPIHISIIFYFSKISHRKWDHICWVHSDNKGKFYVNAELSSQIELTHDAFYFMNEYRNETFDMMLGQEPDSWIGDFNPKQSLRGRISEFNVWDSVISMEMITEMAKCKIDHKGNIASWELEYVDFFNIEPMNMEYDDFCAPSGKLLMISEKMFFADAIDFCKIHGGFLYAPESKEENEKLLELLKNKYEECREPNLGHTEGKALFLTVQRIRIRFVFLDLDPEKYADPRIRFQGAKYHLKTAKFSLYSENPDLNC